MSYNYLKVTIEKNFSKYSQNFDFPSLKNSSPGQFGELKLTHIQLIFRISCCNLKNERSGSKTICGFFKGLILKRIMTL